jgi:hypothetical protein
MLLPRNIERCQWVNKYYRIKVLFNVAGLNPMLYSAKTQTKKFCLFLEPQWLFLFVKGGGMEWTADLVAAGRCTMEK